MPKPGEITLIPGACGCVLKRVWQTPCAGIQEWENAVCLFINVYGDGYKNVRKNDELFIKNEELCIENEEFWFKKRGFLH